MWLWVMPRVGAERFFIGFAPRDRIGWLDLIRHASGGKVENLPPGLPGDGYEERADAYAEGMRAAESIVRRHRIMERWLTDGLGLDWVTADAEAARLEHAVSDVVEQRLYEVLGRPATCPHGNPIPGYSEASPREARVSSLAAGDRATITRVSEVAEREAPLLLAYLSQRDLTPGREITVSESDDVGKTLRVEVAEREVTLSHETASKIWAVPGHKS